MIQVKGRVSARSLSGVYKTLTGGEARSASIAVSALVNGAGNLPGPVSPGEIVVIAGAGLGPGQLIPATPGANGLYSSQLSGRTVRFNGTPVPLIYTSASQVAAQVPDSVSVGAAQVTVTCDGRASASIPGSNCAVRSPRVHARLYRKGASGRAESRRLNQYRRLAGAGRQCHLTLCDRGRPGRRTGGGHDRRSAGNL